MLALFSILLLIYGYSFLKGSDLFSNERTFYVSYDNVAGLTVSAPVTINGYVVGHVNKIEFENVSSANKNGSIYLTNHDDHIEINCYKISKSCYTKEITKETLNVQ